MIDLNKILKDSNLHMICYTGYICFQVSISSELDCFNYFQNISIEFVSDAILTNQSNQEVDIMTNIFSIYGATILEAKILNDLNLHIIFDNGYKITSKSIDTSDLLLDRCWIVKSIENNEEYILNDARDLHYSKYMESALT
jgi:hypothetical protein